MRGLRNINSVEKPVQYRSLPRYKKKRIGILYSFPAIEGVPSLGPRATPKARSRIPNLK